jgi:hypothetical protein
LRINAVRNERQEQRDRSEKRRVRAQQNTTKPKHRYLRTPLQHLHTYDSGTEWTDLGPYRARRTDPHNRYGQLCPGNRFCGALALSMQASQTARDLLFRRREAGIFPALPAKSAFQ